MRENKQGTLWMFIFVVLLAKLQSSFGSSPDSRECKPQAAQHNVTISGIWSGEKDLGVVANMKECIKLSCEQLDGDLAYLLDDRCFLVKCYTTCELVEDPHASSAAARLEWIGDPILTVFPSKGSTTPSTITTTTAKPDIIDTPEKRVKPGEVGPDNKIAKSAEHRLLQDLIYSDSYNKEVRPALNQRDVVNVKFSLKLVQIVDVDEKGETLKVNVWTTQEWKDPFLRWNPNNYEGISNINVEPDLVWLPVIILYNNAADGFAGGLEKYKTKVLIDSNGTVTWFSATQFVSSCKQNIRFFPYDEQYCYLKFGSWTYSTKFLDLYTSQKQADMSSYIKNGEWELIDVPVTENKLYYVCCPDSYADITFTIHMKRKVLYYIFNLIVPTTIIVFFILVGFCLPPITGERITLNITVLLTMTVFLNIASNTLPSTSDSIPLLGDYYLILMIMVCFAILSTCIVLRYYYAGPIRMPERLRVIINEYIASLMFFVITKKPKGKGIRQLCGKQSEEACFDCDETVMARSYVVRNENNMAEERMALVELNSKRSIPRANGIQGKHARAPSSPMKSKSEPVINLTSRPSEVSESRARRRKVSIASRRGSALNTVQNRVIDGLGVLTRKVKEDNERDEMLEEWEFAAIVLDRLFLILYSLTFAIPLLVFFMTAPTPKPSLVEPP